MSNNLTEEEKQEIRERVHRNMAPWRELSRRSQDGEKLSVADLQAAFAFMGYERVEDER